MEIILKRQQYCIKENGKWLKFASLAKAEEYLMEEECLEIPESEGKQIDLIE